MTQLEPIRLQPVFQERVWGGQRLNPGADVPIGEAWVVYEGCVVDGGRWDGQTLGQVAEQTGVALLGRDAVEQTGKRFPLLIKLLHSLEWLSVQVHPNDEQAEKLEGPGHFGKTEAWHVLEAEEGSRVVYGLSGNWSHADLERLIQVGEFKRALNFQEVSAGDTLFTPAGCVHAIGPGLLIYEVQQTSDITYRLFDWNRPSSEGRALHLDKGLSVLGSCNVGESRHVRNAEVPFQPLVQCPYFSLQHVLSTGVPLSKSTEGRSFHALTVTSGCVTVSSGANRFQINELDTVILPASAGEYHLESEEKSEVLIAFVQ